jgi:autotransporter-associated beta strand protein
VTLQQLDDGTRQAKELRLDASAPGAVLSLSGVISEATTSTPSTDDVLMLVKVGAGTATLSGVNTYRGGTEVSAGTLLVSNSTGSGTGLGAVTVLSGATLGGTGIIAPAAGNGVTVNAGAILSVGSPSSASAQSLAINLQSGSAFNLSGSLRLDLFLNQSGTTLAEGDRLLFSTAGSSAINLLAGSTLVVSSSTLSASTFNTGDKWQIIDWGGIMPTGTFAGLAGGFVNDPMYLPDLSSIGRTWDISNLYSTGTIVVAVPEPSRCLSLLMGLLALAALRRRRSLAR